MDSHRSEDGNQRTEVFVQLLLPPSPQRTHEKRPSHASLASKENRRPLLEMASDSAERVKSPRKRKLSDANTVNGDSGSIGKRRKSTTDPLSTKKTAKSDDNSPDEHFYCHQ